MNNNPNDFINIVKIFKCINNSSNILYNKIITYNNIEKMINCQQQDNILSITIYKNVIIDLRTIQHLELYNVVNTLLINKIYEINNKYYELYNNFSDLIEHNNNITIKYYIREIEYKSYLDIIPEDYISIIFSYLSEKDLQNFSSLSIFKSKLSDLINIMHYIKYNEISKIFSIIKFDNCNYNKLYINKVLENIKTDGLYNDLILSMKTGSSLNLSNVGDSLGFLRKLYEGLIKLNHKEISLLINYELPFDLAFLYNDLSNLKTNHTKLYNMLLNNLTNYEYDYYQTKTLLFDSYIIVIILKIVKDLDTNTKFQLLSLIPSYHNMKLINKMIRELGNIPYTGPITDNIIRLEKKMTPMRI